MAYYVVGGEYQDTSFRKMLRSDPPEGPFDDYDEALERWRVKSIRRIDEAFVRYLIVEADAESEALARAS